MKPNMTIMSTLALSLALAAPVMAHGEATSTVNATYAPESKTVPLANGEKVENLYTKNNAQDFILQKLTDRTFWVQSQFYATIFYVGDEGVLLFDPLEGRSAPIKAAIDEVTDLPVTAIVYSHDHADHIGSASDFLDEAADIRIIASAATDAILSDTGSAHPKPTERIEADGRFTFEDLIVSYHAANASGHAPDYGAWLLEGQPVVHLPDVINPDQPPFCAFAGSVTYLGYQATIDVLDSLEWDYLCGGHGNVGSRDDITFYRAFLADLETAVGEALGSTPWGAGIDDPAALNAHTAYLPAWFDAISVKVTGAL